MDHAKYACCAPRASCISASWTPILYPRTGAPHLSAPIRHHPVNTYATLSLDVQKKKPKNAHGARVAVWGVRHCTRPVFGRASIASSRGAEPSPLIRSSSCAC
jgi:hypothetical protein